MQIIGDRFYGRLKTRALTKRQEGLVQSVLPKFLFKSFADINMQDYDKVFFEIGFGGGEHIAKMALNNPNDLFIGAEPFVNGMVSLLSHIEENNIKNILIFNDDARTFIKNLPCDVFLDGVFLLFPDPWPKRKHFVRRFVQEKNILSIYNILKTGGFWKIATDHPSYASWILKMFARQEVAGKFLPELFNSQSRPSEESWPKTRYEQKTTFQDILFANYVKL